MPKKHVHAWENDNSWLIKEMYCTFVFLAIDGLTSDIVKNKLKSNKRFKNEYFDLQWGLFQQSLSSRDSENFKCQVMEMCIHKLSKLCNYKNYGPVTEKSLRSEGSKTFQHASFFMPSSIFITPVCEKMSIKNDSFILLWL